MRLLILGGTGFVGRVAAEVAVDRGHLVTVYHRGSSPSPAGVATVLGNRGDLSGLSGEWDVVIDTWSAAPDAVEVSARALKDRVGRYVYVSSRSVYQYPAEAGWAEDAPVVAAGEPGYASDKRGGELAVLDVFGSRAMLARAGLVLGPHENVGRLPWWLNRIARGGRFLAPGPADLPLQLIDARDLADFMLRDLTGVYNVVSPSGHTTMAGLLAACQAVTGGDATPVWTDPAAVEAAGIAAWTDLPIWLPPGPDHDFMHRGDVSRALAVGLRCRPVEETVADTWAWLNGIGGVAPLRPDRPAVGLDPQTEDRVIQPA